MAVELDHATLITLAQGAEFMAAESQARDRNGRCSSYLYDAARKARRLAAELRDTRREGDEWDAFGRDCDGQPRQ